MKNGKDIRNMAALFKHVHRHRTEKRKLIINLITSSNCWAGINDLRPKFTAISARNNLTHKKPDCNRTLSNEKNKEY